jgi:hydrogenase-4 membrane subunit HyfE
MVGQHIWIRHQEQWQWLDFFMQVGCLPEAPVLLEPEAPVLLEPPVLLDVLVVLVIAGGV